MTSFSSFLCSMKSFMFSRVVAAMLASASRVKNAWWEVTITLLNDNKRARAQNIFYHIFSCSCINTVYLLSVFYHRYAFFPIPMTLNSFYTSAFPLPPQYQEHTAVPQSPVLCPWADKQQSDKNLIHYWRTNAL